MTSGGSTYTMTFDVPVVVSGPIDANVSGGLTFVSQVQSSPTVVSS